MRNIRVFLADDHMLMRQGMRSLLEMEEDIAVVGEASNGHDAVDKVINGLRPHIVLMDVHMPVMTGIEATRRIKLAMPDIVVIGLTASEDDATIAEMLKAGASGYILKSAAASELVKSIRSARSDRETMINELHQRINHFTNRNSYTERSAEPAQQNIHQHLTRREIDVMEALMRGYSNKEIARSLVISERTVQTHLSNIFSKMEVNSRTEAVLVAMRDGWVVHQMAG
jgi:DNA-binding NarL/FixJ family response regulator